MNHRPLVAGCLLAAGLLIPSARPVRAADPPQPAVVDLTRVLNVYRKTSAFAKQQQQFAEKEKAFADELAFLALLRYCTEDERREAISIREMGEKASAPQKAKLDGFTKRADEFDRELNTLSQKQNPSEAESKRITALSELRSKASQWLQEAAADRRGQLQKMDSDMTDAVRDDLLKIVESVAKESKVGVVYSRDAILFGGLDLTDRVIRKLAK
jgi:Skp family chaperone for outer membrane proteins